MPSGDYVLRTDFDITAEVFPASGKYWPHVRYDDAAALTIDYVAGPVDGQDTKPEAKQAIKLLVRHWFDNASAVGQIGRELELGVASLVRSLGTGYYADVEVFPSRVDL